MIKNLTFAIAIVLMGSHITKAQIDPSLLRDNVQDTLSQRMNMDAVYNRPFLNVGKLPVSLGGYAEINWQHIATDGVSDGHQFQMRRMTLFVASTINKRIKFLSELEFEDGGKEIAIEFAAIDVELHPLLNLRAGIVMNPIGAFNQNHDGPKWEFVDRPISATQMLPATFSNAGFGLYGKQYSGDWMMGYEVYLTGGFDNSIVDNTENKTFLAAAKNNQERFNESASGKALLSGKAAVRNRHYGELGLSYMGGIYNSFEQDGIQLDVKRRCDIWAIDYNNTLAKTHTYITAEWAWVHVAIPSSYTQQYGNRQHGGFIDIVQPILRRPIFGWQNASLNLAFRAEYVDWNVGYFTDSGSPIGDELWSIVPAISLRPSQQTVFRLNYRYQWQKDILGNLPARTAGFSFGISTYF